MDSECNLVHEYPVTVGCSQQVIQSCTEVVHDPLVKYLFRISGNLRIQTTGMDKMPSKSVLCKSIPYLPRAASRHSHITNHFTSVLKYTFQTWTPLLVFFCSSLPGDQIQDTAAGSEKKASQDWKMGSLQIQMK